MTKDRMINLRLPEEIVEFISEGLYFNGLLRKKFHIDSYQQAAEKHIVEAKKEVAREFKRECSGAISYAGYHLCIDGIQKSFEKLCRKYLGEN